MAGTRALRLWTAVTFADTGAHILTLTTWSGNARMLRAAQRHDSVKLAALRRDWPGASAGCENAGL